MKNKYKKLPLFLIVLSGLFSFSLNSAEPETEVLPQIVIELDEFGFKGDFHWLRFEEGFRQAWEESAIPYDLTFKKFPVRDYKGKPAIELRLNHWRVWRTGEREINFWATYVSPSGKKHKLDIIMARDMAFDPTYSALERNYKKNAYEAALKLLEIVKPLIGENS